MRDSAQLKHPLLKCMLVTLVVGLLALSPSLIKYHGQFIFYGDFITQYMPFIRETRRMLLSGSLNWSWNSFLGDHFFSSYSYYTSTNPFAMIAALFPDQLILYAATFVTLLKFMLSSLSAYLFLRLFAKRDMTAVIGAVVYTFSGFAIIVTNYFFFLDVVAAFPLLLYGLERLIRHEHGITDGLVLVFAVFLNAVMNYYLFVASCILCLLYVIFRLELWRFRDRYADKLRHCGHMIGYGFIGLLLSAFALFPSFLRMMDNPKASGLVGSEMPVVYSLGNLLERLRIFFMPIESHTYHGFYSSYSRGSVAVFLGLFGCVFALAFLWRNRKSWISKLWIALIVILFVPIFNSAFNLFTDVRYTRWLYGMVLVMDLATVHALDCWDEPDFRALLKKIYKISLIAMLALSVPISGIGLLIKMGLLPQKPPLIEWFAAVCTSTFTGFSSVFLAIALALGNYFLLGIALYGGNRIGQRMVLLFTCICCACNFAVYYVINYQMPTTDTYSVHEYYTKFMEQGTVNESQTDFVYRTDSPKGVHNYGLFFKNPSVNYYHSIQNKNAAYFATFAGIVDAPRRIFMDIPDDSRAELDTLLSVKYFQDYMQTENVVVPDGFAFTEDTNGVKVYENGNYLPMGFTYDSYVTTEDALADTRWTTPQIMLTALCIDKADEARVSELLDKLDLTASTAQPFVLSDAADARRTECADSFAGTADGFTSTITLSRDNYVFYSVPYQEEWSATVNGETAELIKVCDGLVAVRCSAGANEIRFVYHSSAVTIGLLLTGIGLIAVVVLLILRRKERRCETKKAV